LIIREPFVPVEKSGAHLCRFEKSLIDAEQDWPFPSVSLRGLD
jgi:hypothetical protein